jgi:pyrroloquinoline quinone (PQQ) biosynthesis protein C
MITHRVSALIEELNEMTNAQFETPEFQHLLSVPLTLPRIRCYTIHMAHYVRNRRDCWAFVQAAVPIDIKKLIWEHEREELAFDPRAGSDHIELANKEAKEFGLTPEDIENAELSPHIVAAHWAWVHLAKSRPWLEVFTASAAIERRNSDEVVRGGALSSRMREKMENELGMPVKRLENTTIHMAADVEHGRLLEIVAERYATTDEACQTMLRAARDTYIIDRAWRGGLAEAMEDLP